MTTEEIQEIKEALEIGELRREISELRREFRHLEHKVSGFWYRILVLLMGTAFVYIIFGRFL